MTELEQVQELLAQLRQQGIRLQVQDNRLQAAGNASVMNKETAKRIKQHKSALIELLGSAQESEVSIQPDLVHRHQPFPLNENQQAYWLGRSAHLEGGNVAIHLYFELDATGLDINRLEQAWQQLVDRHEMLRAVVTPDGKQQILENTPPVSIGRQQASKPDFEQNLLDIRERLSHQNFDLKQWPQFEFACLSDDEDKQTLCLSIDCWAIDGWSYQVLFVEWAQLYFSNASLPEFDLSFRDYRLAIKEARDTAAGRAQLAWWQKHAADLPNAPDLPRASRTQDTGIFQRRSFWLQGEVLANVRKWCSQQGVSVAATLLTAYAAVLQRWSDAEEFTLNIPRYNRQPIHPDVKRIVGEFGSFSLLALDWREPAGFTQRVKTVQQDLLRVVAKNMVSGVEVLRMRNEARGSIGSMPYVFTNAPEQMDADGTKQSFIDALERFGPLTYAVSQTPQVWIDCQYHESKKGLYLFWDVRQGIFPAGMAEQMFDAYTDLLVSLGENRLDDRQPLHIHTSIPEPKLFSLQSLDIWQRLEQQVQQLPAAPALTTPQATLSWQQLHDHSLALAAILAQLGVGYDASNGNPSGLGRVLLLAEKSQWQVIAVLGAMHRGLTIVPLDVTTPKERLEFIASDTNAICVLYSPKQQKVAESLSIAALPIASPSHIQAPARLPAPEVLMTIYTSGSTDQPKGVDVCADALFNSVDYTLEKFDINRQDRLLALTQLHDDTGWFDLLAVISCGAQLIYPDNQYHRDPLHWLTLIRQHKITVWNSVPQLMEMLLSQTESRFENKNSPLKSLRLAFLGRDWISLRLPERLARSAPNSQLISVGGYTETTLWNIMYLVTSVADDWQSIPFGYPIANNHYHIIDTQGRDCPIGVIGELCCTGMGVSPGYLNRPHLNAEKFRRHRRGQRMFCTGDQGRYRADGSIEFMGSQDTQMILRGCRIEPQEVVKHLCTLSGVDNAELAIVDGQLVAWLVASSEIATSGEQIAETLAQWLPSQMIPSCFYQVKVLPLTADGKVDRKQLVTMLDQPLAQTKADEQPLTSKFEEQVAAYWQTVLGAAPQNREEDFFRCGGNSLKAVKLYSFLWPQGHEDYSVVSLFEHRTVAAQGALLANSRESDSGTLLVAKHLTEAPLTRAQQRIWFSEQLNPNLSVYNLPYRISIGAEVDLTKAADALQAAFGRHQIFRSVITDSGRWQYKSELRGVIDIIDEAKTEEQVLELARQQGGQHFDTAQGPLWCAKLVKHIEGHVELLLSIHHIVFDGWSLALLLDDWQANYSSGDLPEPALQFFDYADYEQAQDDSKEDTEFWLRQMDGYQPLALPTDFDRPTKQSFEVDTLSRHLNKAQFETIQGCATDAQTTLFVVIASTWQLLLSRYADQDDLVVGTHIAQRGQPELQQLPGLFLNNLVLRTRLSADMPFSALLTQQSEYCRNAFGHADLPFDSLVSALAEPRDASRHPLYQVSVVVDNSEINRDQSDNPLNLTLQTACQKYGHMDLELNVQQFDNEMRVNLVYATDLFCSETIERLADQFVHLLDQVVSAPDQPLSSFSFNTPSQQALIEDAGTGAVEEWPDSRMISIWDETVKRQPEKVAIYEADQTITFSELDRKANTLANALYDQGIRPEDVLALHLAPGIDSVTVILASIQLGCCYLPLQPDLPEERKSRMLEVADCKWVIGEELFLPGRKHLSLSKLQADVVSEGRQWQCRSAEKTRLYMVFTSGSTGEPKAIAASERAVLNRFHWSWTHMPFETGECSALKTAPGFVDAVWETLGPLLKGCPLAVISYLDQLEPARLVAQLARYKVTRLLMVPSLMDTLLAWCEEKPERVKQLSQLRWLSLSGETLSATLAARLQAALANTQVFNFYGSAEVGADVLATRLERDDSEFVPIGRPLSNTSIQLVDSWGTLTPLGGRGEMVISGAQVADGYVNQHKHDQFINVKGERRFLSHDLGRLRHDGQFSFLGRNDHTVKIRGQRLELEDVDRALLACEGVSAAAAQPIDNQLLGAMVVLDGATLAEVQSSLRSRLPSWMVPGRWRPCDALPLLPSGKVDRRRIQRLLAARPETATDVNYHSDWSPTELKVSEFWQSLTNQPVEDRLQSFFDSGGHSLLLGRLLNQINQHFNLSLDITSLYTSLELVRMAALVDALSGDAASLEKVEEEGVI